MTHRKSLLFMIFSRYSYLGDFKRRVNSHIQGKRTPTYTSSLVSIRLDRRQVEANNKKGFTPIFKALGKFYF